MACSPLCLPGLLPCFIVPILGRYQFGMYLFNIPVHAIFLTVAFDDDKYDDH